MAEVEARATGASLCGRPFDSVLGPPIGSGRRPQKGWSVELCAPKERVHAAGKLPARLREDADLQGNRDPQQVQPGFGRAWKLPIKRSIQLWRPLPLQSRQSVDRISTQLERLSVSLSFRGQHGAALVAAGDRVHSRRLTDAADAVASLESSNAIGGHEIVARG